jgi:hypothetical protein
MTREGDERYVFEFWKLSRRGNIEMSIIEGDGEGRQLFHITRSHRYKKIKL